MDQSGITYNQEGNINIDGNFKNWFGESKVVDAEGKPLVVYHGGTFDENVHGIPDTAGKGKKGWQLPFGMHFATDVAEANAYVPTKKGELTQAYVSLRNPLRLAPKRVIIGGEEKNVYTPVTKGQYENLPSDFKKKYDKQYKSGFGEGEGDLGYGYTEWFESVLQSMKPTRAKEVVQEMGYDGIIYTAKANYDNRRYRPFDAFIAFSPTQVKSINNRGTFDPNNPNILMGAAPLALTGLLGKYDKNDEKEEQGKDVKTPLAQKKTKGYANGGMVKEYNPKEIDEIANMVREGIYG